MAFEERGAIEACKEKSQLSTFYCPVEVPKSPVEAMDFLSRTWSPSSSDFFQMLSSNVSILKEVVVLIDVHPLYILKNRFLYYSLEAYNIRRLLYFHLE